MQVTTLPNGRQLAYLKIVVEGFILWVASPDATLFTSAPAKAYGYEDSRVMRMYFMLVQAGVKGVSITNGLPLVQSAGACATTV